MRAKAGKALMRISATGNLKARRRREAGFSLVEALLALAIIGLMAGAVLVLAPRGERASAAFAERLAARLAEASDESIMINRTIALAATTEGYGFARLEEGGWAPIQDGRRLGFEIWPEGVEVRIEGEAPAALRRVGDTIHLARFDPVGAASPVELIVRDKGEPVWRVEVDGQGRTRLAPME